ncbi:MAG: RelA/SpoT AH/RIS domain-containing protein, partial [Steroidobacter sp.]
MPLRTPLRNGQTIEVITAKGAMPNPAWVNFVVTAKARTAVRHYLKGLKSGDAAELGKRLLTQSLMEVGLNFKNIKPAQWAKLATDFSLKSTTELFEKVGLGERLAPLVAQHLVPKKDADHTQTISGPLAIAGTEGLSVSYARCCFPIPNDPIMAYVTTGHGIVVHREACGNLKSFRKQPDKWLTVIWQAAPGKLFN